MFLGLSTGKKIGVIAASLAVLTCLSLLCSALAAPSPSSGLGDFVQVTPTPTPTGNGPNVAPPNPNGPGSGSGGGGGAAKAARASRRILHSLLPSRAIRAGRKRISLLRSIPMK